MERGDRAEAVHPIEPGVNEVTQPLPIAPSTARERERKRVLTRYRVMPQDPFAGAISWLAEAGTALQSTRAEDVGFRPGPSAGPRAVSPRAIAVRIRVEETGKNGVDGLIDEGGALLVRPRGRL